MKRIVVGLVWAVVFFVASVFTLGFVAGFQAGFKNPNDPARAQKAGEEAAEKLLEKYSLGILIGSCICAAVLAGGGVLPGTQRLAADDARPDPSAPASPQWGGQVQLSSLGYARSTMTYHFDARIARTFLPNYVHRVYLAGDDLLLVNFKVTTLDPSKIAMRTTMAMGGGLLPALVGWAMAGDAQDQLTKMNNLLAGADQARVRQYLAETRQGYAMSLHDVKSAVLERAGFFDFAGTDCKAILRIKHAHWGEMTFHLLTDEDMGIAASELVSRLGERMKCKL